MEPQWRRLQSEFAGVIKVVYKMAGLLPSWKNFNDSLNSIRKPVQMGPEWMHARYVSGMPIVDKIWITDPPDSSFPACIAVKCAQLQSPELGADYLRLVREAVMIRNDNIAKKDILLGLAAGLTKTQPSFNAFTFQKDLLEGRGKDAFKADWQETKYLGITRLPTLLFRSEGQPARMLTGYQPYEVLKNALVSVASCTSCMPA